MAHILLVDDDDLLRDTVLQLLERDGHRVVEATDGHDALARYGAGRFDLIITDVLMPGMDGAQLIVELRKRDAHLPILAISGGRRILTPEFNLQTAELAGATLQLAKPFGRAQLQQAVSQAMAG